MSTSGRLTEVYGKAKRICYSTGEKFVIMSDCHRGVGTLGDNFLKNRHIFLTALRYYYRRGFSYVELGDGEELWENKEPEEVLATHREVYRVLEDFHRDGRLYMLFGNHDIQKKKDGYFKEHCSGFVCEESGKETVFFRGLSVEEGLILEERGTGRELFLVHGHQGDLFNDRLWRVNRFLVRHIWRRLELLGMENPMSASGSGKKKTKVERKLAEWADNNRQVMIAGHTHRVKFLSDGSSYYFNDGSCVRPSSITALELEKGLLRLVEWSVMTRDDHSMYVGRKITDEIPLEQFDKQ